MRKRVVGLIVTVVVAFLAVWLWETLRPSSVVEVEAKVLPTGSIRIMLTRDLDGDGNDELVVESSPWHGKGCRVFVVTMKNGRIVAYPTPFVHATVSWTGGKRLIGVVRMGKHSEVTVVQLLPNGEWRLEKPPEYGIAAIGDWGGDGEDNTALVLKRGKGLILVFQRQPNGKWRKVEEIKLPVSTYSIYGQEWGVETLPSDIPLFFWQGRWHLGQEGETIHRFRGDWDGDGQPDELLVRVSPDHKTVTMHLTLALNRPKEQRRYLEWKQHFTDWQIHPWRTGVLATDQLGDKRWHLLMLQFKLKPLTLRMMDYQLTSHGNWQGAELARWRLKAPFGDPPLVEIFVGESDGDGKPEIFIEAPRNCLCRLTKTGSRWKPQPLGSSWQRGVFIVGGRVLFYLLGPGGLEFGTFKADGSWETKSRLRLSETSYWHELADLNGDMFPEVLTFQGQTFPRPVVYWWTGGEWRRQKLAGASLLRLAEFWLRTQGAPFEPYVSTVQWEGKEWFVVLWGDGVVQAVTLPSRP